MYHAPYVKGNLVSEYLPPPPVVVLAVGGNGLRELFFNFFSNFFSHLVMWSLVFLHVLRPLLHLLIQPGINFIKQINKLQSVNSVQTLQLYFLLLS